MRVSEEITVASPQGPGLPAGLELTHRFLDALPELCLAWQADPAPSPELVVLDDALASELGLDPHALSSPAGFGLFTGAGLPAGAEPVALGYAGHQFGNYSPRLGDGRALLLGELAVGDGLVDVHLKGSGRTPFARGGDGKATLGPMLREYLVARFLHAVGVPTTRSLAVVTTGERIFRDGPEPGAVLTRVAASHIRVGTFEYAVRLGGTELVRRLADHAISRHHPAVWETDNPYVALLDAVIDAQADLVAQWMLIGFIHGVMNTDNMAISGEGIDYGPCAFMDRYDPNTVFSSIDHSGRYAFGNQPKIAAWNLARFAETLLGLISDEPEEAVEAATALVQDFPDRFTPRWQAGMAAKLGLDGLPGDDPTLFDDLGEVLQADQLDWTGTFRGLAGDLRRRAADGTGRIDGNPVGAAHADAGLGGAGSSAWQQWKERWIVHLGREGRPLGEVADGMDRVNPVNIPRNHLVDEALTAATNGDPEPFHRLVGVLADPYHHEPGQERYAQPAPDGFTQSFRTFCGT